MANMAATIDRTAAALEDRLLLKVQDLEISFRTDEGLITPVAGVDFEVPKGKTLGIVGESGSGKSVSTKALMKLLPKTAIIGQQSRMLFRKIFFFTDIFF